MNRNDLPPIVQRNLDVEHIMLAACRYGHHGRGVRNRYKQLSFLAVTDVHGSADRMTEAVEYLNYYDALDFGICLGDIQPAHFLHPSEWYTNAVLAAEKPFFTVLGNHDLGNSADGKIAATTEMAFEKFIHPVKEKIGVEGLCVPYYVKCFEDYKVALIALFGFDTPDEKDEDGNYKIARGTEMYGQAQIDWLIKTLAEIPSDYHLLIASHSFAHGYEKIENCFTQPDGELNRTSRANPYGDTELLTDIVHAWMTGTSLSGTYTPVREDLPTITVNCDFSARGEGIFVGHLIGHFHHDIVARSKKYPAQNIVSLVSGADDVWQNHACDLPRAEGTKAQDAITAVTVDTLSRSLRLVRIGSNMTMDMTERIYTVLRY